MYSNPAGRWNRDWDWNLPLNLEFSNPVAEEMRVKYKQLWTF